MRYQGGFDVFGLIEAAKKELAQPAPEQFKVFLLAVMAGRADGRLTHWSGAHSAGRGAPFDLNQQSGFIQRCGDRPGAR
jgi:hypothetical protein